MAFVQDEWPLHLLCVSILKKHECSNSTLKRSLLWICQSRTLVGTLSWYTIRTFISLLFITFPSVPWNANIVILFCIDMVQDYFLFGVLQHFIQTFSACLPPKYIIPENTKFLGGGLELLSSTSYNSV